MSMTREQWLNKLTTSLRPLFLNAGADLSEKIRVTCGWPSSGAKAKNLILGECWDAKNSDDKTFEIFISPTLDNATEVAGVLVHELVHVAVGVKVGHRAPFKKLATILGLEGPMTATTVNEELAQTLAVLVGELGEYPHAKISFDRKEKVQGTRMLKVICPDPACGYTVRTTQKWINLGTPVCCCGTKMEVEQKTPPEGGEVEVSDLPNLL